MIINLVGGAPVDLLPDLAEYHQENSLWVGIDRGVPILLSKGIIPALGFGDFDSVSSAEWEFLSATKLKVEKFRPEKDETDMELALNWALQQEPEEIRIFGGTGGRFDHMYANIQLLLRPIIQKKTTRITLIDRNNFIYLEQSGVHSIVSNPDFRYVSFFPITPIVRNLSLKGFKYPLTDCHIPLGSTLCISNELINDSGTFSFDEGIIMVIRSRDEKSP